ncbi:MAG: Peptidase M23 [Microgenomates group bacterium Gr01-1014_80]|nr:MAG: Peptidase M23 [Microgenomates group bacterium Gr01-1014_80]
MTRLKFFVKIRQFLKILKKSLLPKELQRRVALNSVASNNKPRLVPLSRNFSRLPILFLLILNLLGYQPVLSFPPIIQNAARASDEQTQKIEADFLPQIQLPHPGYLSTRFSRWHPGIDLATGLGMPVHPVAEGIIEEVNFGIFGYGNDVIVSHPKGLKSLYGHMGRIYVKKGQSITSQDTLGTVGLTGFTSGPHTHLEIYRDGKTINPLTVLPPVQDYPGDPSADGLNPVGGKTLKPDFN